MCEGEKVVGSREAVSRRSSEGTRKRCTIQLVKGTCYAACRSAFEQRRYVEIVAGRRRIAFHHLTARATGIIWTL
jgi:hypothetical protein